MILCIDRLAIVMVSCALLTWGCGSTSEGRGDDASAAPVSSQGNHHAVRLSGCLEPSGMAMAEYVLRRVHVENRIGQDPHRTTSSPAGGGIIEGSWVRLSGSRDLRGLAGHRVQVFGVLVDPGQVAVGTKGGSGVILPSGDISRAATDEAYWVKVRKEAGPIGHTSLAAADAPEVRVTEIKDLGETCHEPNDHR